MSEGDWKKTTFFSRDLKIKKIDNDKVINIKNMKKNLNLTFLPYMIKS